MTRVTGVPASPSGSCPAGGAASASPAKPSIPNAVESDAYYRGLKAYRGAGYTPGPWTCTPNDLRGGRFYSIEIPGRDRNGDHFEPIDIHELDNGEANARLIAAAPELYEALELVLDTYGFDSSTDSSIWQTVVAALAKARGEQA